MALNIKYYNPANVLTGGAIDTGSLLGSVVETSEQSVNAVDFCSVTSEQGTDQINFYFRKFFIKNEDVDDIVEPHIYLDNLEYPEQLALARGGASDTTTQPYVMPSGYESSDFIECNSYEDRIPVYEDTSDLAVNASVGFWMRIRAYPDLPYDASAVGTVKIRGYRSA